MKQRSWLWMIFIKHPYHGTTCQRLANLAEFHNWGSIVGLKGEALECEQLHELFNVLKQNVALCWLQCC